MKSALLSACLLFALACGVVGKTIKFPAKNPVFTLTLPDDWTVEPSGKTGLECKAGDGSNYTFDLRAIPVKTEKELKFRLAELLRSLENPDLKNFKVGEVEETMVGEMKVFVCQASATLSGTPAFLTARAFAPTKGAYFTAMALAFEKVELAHREVMREILSSVKPVPAASGPLTDGRSRHCQKSLER